MSDEKQDAKDAPPAKKSRKALVVTAAAAIVLLGGGGGAAWYFMKAGADETAEAAHKASAKKNRSFANLEPFTINLADEGGERFAQVAVVLELGEPKVSEQISANMPAVRNTILLLLSSKQSKDLLTVAGKERLAAEIAVAAGREIGWTPPEPDRRAQPVKKPVSDSTTEDAARDADPAADDQDDEKAKKKREKARKPGAPNPVTAVHFAQFIVQ